MENLKDFLTGFAVIGAIVFFMCLLAFHNKFKNHEERIEKIEQLLGEKK